MTSLLFVTIFLVIVFWGLLRLKEIREAAVEDIRKPDKVMILIGLYYILSAACIRYYRENGSYPQAVIGDPEGLIEMGYLQEEPLAKLTSAVKLFSMVTSDKAGVGVCLAHTSTSVTNEIVRRAKETSRVTQFVDYKSGQFIPLELPVSRFTINLTMPLPLTPYGTEKRGDRLES